MTSTAIAEPPNRIHENLTGRTYQLQGNTPPLLPAWSDKGKVSDETPLSHITIHFAMSDAQQTALKNLLSEQQNLNSSQYHKWLTPEQYGERFGISSSDLDKIQRWLNNSGFRDVRAARSRTSVSMSGTVGLAEYAFQTPIHSFAVNGVLHHASIVDPTLPAALQGMVISVRGLSNLQPRPRSHPRFTSSISTNNFIAPGDFATVYDITALYNSGIDGTGQKIAIAGQTDIQLFDIEAFQKAAGLTIKDPTVILDGTDPGLSAADLSEAELDIEWAGAIARGATIVYVNSSDAWTSAIYAIDNQVANVLSITYGGCEAQTDSATMTTLNNALQQASAEGITVVAASGDSGAADCDGATNSNVLDTSAINGLAVDFPASSPYVTAAGGTAFNEGSGTDWSSTNGPNQGSVLSYIPEVAWNDDCAPGATSATTDCSGTATYGLSATGGGASAIFSKPSWQAGTGVPDDGFRDVPDVSFASSPNHDGYLICETPPTNGVAATTSSCVNGTFRDATNYLNVIGGTSVSAPAFAAIVAIVDQMTGTAQGNVNPRLYTLAALMPDVYHDITVGNNIVPCTVGTTDCTTGIFGYNTTVGYDQVTGLGSIDANNLVQNFEPTYGLSLSSSALTLASSSSANAMVSVAAVGAFTGTVSFTCSVPSTLGNTTCSIPGSVTGSGTTTVTISNTTSASVGSTPQWGWPFSGNLLIPVSAMILALITGLAAAKKAARPLAGLAFLSAVLMTSCGSGNSSGTSGSSSSTSTLTATAAAPSVTGTITITAISTATPVAPSITKTITLSVTEP